MTSNLYIMYGVYHMNTKKNDVDLYNIRKKYFESTALKFQQLNIDPWGVVCFTTQTEYFKYRILALVCNITDQQRTFALLNDRTLTEIDLNVLFDANTKITRWDEFKSTIYE